jgi:hypothetical protein
MAVVVVMAVVVAVIIFIFTFPLTKIYTLHRVIHSIKFFNKLLYYNEL